jgi:hypothetical protein
MGQPMDATPPMLTPGVPTMVWGGPIRLMARGLGLTLDEIRETVVKRPLPQTVTTQLGQFDAGTMGAFRLEIAGIVGGRPLLVVDHVTRIVNDIAPEWPKPKGDGAHGVAITGRPNLTVTFDPEDDTGSAAGGGNTTAAARIVNAIPFVLRGGAGHARRATGAAALRTRASAGLNTASARNPDPLSRITCDPLSRTTCGRGRG